MNLSFKTDGLCVPVSDQLTQMLTLQLMAKQADLPIKIRSVVFNFRDDSYDPETGGFHPVEIRVAKHREHWEFDYITDFSYQGHSGMAELVKEFDIEFASGQVYHLFTGYCDGKEAADFYQLWESNFLSYVESGFLSVEVALD